MKKSLFTLAAAVVALASCTSDDLLVDNNVVNTDTKQTAIGFGTFADKATRAASATDLEYYHSTFSVYGTKKSTVDAAVSDVFDATTITHSTASNPSPNEWTYSPLRFWDKQADYNFIAVAPDATVVEYSKTSGAEVGASANNFVTVSGGYTLTGQNLQSTATTAEIITGFVGGTGKDTDIMTSANVPQAGSTANGTTVVGLTFKHILSKLNVTVAKANVLDGSTVEVKSIEITGLDNNGTYSENTYDASASPKKSGWTPAAAAANSTYKLSYKGSQALNASAGNPYYFIESLVMPQAVSAEKITLKYTVTTDTHAEDFTYQMDLKDAFTSFFDRYNYKINFTIGPDVIKFDAGVTEWDNQSASNITVN